MIMYAIWNKEIGKFVSGTDYRRDYGLQADGINHTYRQIMDGSALTFPDKWDAEQQFKHRGCSSKRYKIVKVDLVEADNETD